MMEIFYMFVCFAMLFVIGGFVLLIHILDMGKKRTDKMMLTGVLVYLVERFRK